MKKNINKGKGVDYTHEGDMFEEMPQQPIAVERIEGDEFSAPPLHSGNKLGER